MCYPEINTDNYDCIEKFDIQCKDWKEFKNKVSRLTNHPDETLDKKEWVFRGVLKRHKMETTLERSCKYWDINLQDLPIIEKQLIREIKRKAFGLGIPLPPEKDDMWWISLMQHYGAPTRLLDFTYSPYVAAYFALEKLLVDSCKQESAAVWAIQHAFTDTKSIEQEQLNKIKKSEYKSLNFLFNCDKPKMQPAVLQVNSTYLHDRLIVQQGIFLCPTDISKTFMQNFESMPKYNNKKYLKRFILQKTVIKEAMADLQKMNITRQSLFPGISGLAESIIYRLPYFKDLAEYNKRMK